MQFAVMKSRPPVTRTRLANVGQYYCFSRNPFPDWEKDSESHSMPRDFQSTSVRVVISTITACFANRWRSCCDTPTG